MKRTHSKGTTAHHYVTRSAILGNVMANEQNALHCLGRADHHVAHLREFWPIVLQRYELLLGIGRNTRLVGAFRDCNSAHIVNDLQYVLVADLVREVCALVLDDDNRTGSLRRVYRLLNSTECQAGLESEYRKTVPLRIFDDDLTPELRASVEAQYAADEVEQSLSEMRSLAASVAALRDDVLCGPTANKIWMARSKAVVHREMVNDVQIGWRLWEASGDTLTYDELDHYIALCSRAIEKMSLYVCRAHIEFEDFREVRRTYVSEFVEALAIGREAQQRREG
jgi:hypothetical protein